MNDRGLVGGDACRVDEGCITCGDVALPLTVVRVDGTDARCRDDEGHEEEVALDLVGTVTEGDRLLVHAGVAIERLGGDAERGGDGDPIRRRVP